MDKRPKILITGKPGSGKTTIIKELARFLGERAGGFYTEEIREGGERKGFRIVTLDGKTGVLAGVNIAGPRRVGKYGVSCEDIEKIAIPAVDEAIKGSRVVIFDEIGPMELFSAKFREMVLSALEAPNAVIATIKSKGSPFLDMIKGRPEVTLYDISSVKREKVMELIKGICRDL